MSDYRERTEQLVAKTQNDNQNGTHDYNPDQMTAHLFIMLFCYEKVCLTFKKRKK